MRIPKKVTERFIKQVGSYQKILASAQKRDVSEADTATIVADIISDVFGFDKYSDITGEQAIRGTFCDLAVKSDDAIDYIVEVKAIGLDLKENHLRQAVQYGLDEGVRWVVLTNGIIWEIYRIRFERPVDYDLLCSINFLDINPRKEEYQDRLFLLSKEGIDKSAIEEFHDHVKSVNKYTISAILQSESLLGAVRRELRKLSDGVKVTNDEIETIIVSDVLKREVVEGDSAEKAKKQVQKIVAKQKKPKKVVNKETTDASQVAPETYHGQQTESTSEESKYIPPNQF